MKFKGIAVFIVACLDVVLVALSVGLGFSSEVCFNHVAHSETSIYNWYCMPRTDGAQPQDCPEFAFIDEFDAYWVGDPDEKVIYLTFDAGYENGYTPQILDALKKHDAPAAFFLVGHYMKTAPDLVKRMTEEGHLVCSHSMNHKDMAAMTDFAQFTKEMKDLEKLYNETTGKPLANYFRPPEGKFSELCLKYAQQLGYKTFFWSIAYKDWYVDAQPAEQDAINTIISRTHPGAVVLLHATSATNAAILDRLITQWESMGYRLESLDKYPFPSNSQ